MLNVIMLNVIMKYVITLNAIIQSILMLNVIILSVNTLRAMATYQTRLALAKDKYQPAGQSQGRVFNSRRGCVKGMHFSCYEAKLPNLE